MFPTENLPIVTYALIALTVLVSLLAEGNGRIKEAFIFHGPAVQRGQSYRFLTSGLIHNDLFHLLFNMYALFLFGRLVEERMVEMAPQSGRLLYLALYVLALWASELPTYGRHKNNHHYFSLGASGAVSAVIFAGILLFPTLRMGFFFLPPMPGYVFGPLYLLLSYWLDKRGGGNINHSAHLWGALFGIGFIIVAGYATGNTVLADFMEQVRMAWSR